MRVKVRVAMWLCRQSRENAAEIKTRKGFCDETVCVFICHRKNKSRRNSVLGTEMIV